MSTKNKTSKNGGSDITDKKLRALWKNIPAAKLAELLRIKNPHGKWSSNGHRVTGRCPYHDDNNPSFTISIDRGFGKCYSCETFVGNPISFWAKVTGLSKPDALGDLKQHFALDGISDATGAKMAAWDRSQRLKKDILRLAHTEMLDALASPTDPEFAQAQPAVRYLLDVRKIPPDALPALGILGILPPLLKIVETLTKEMEARNEIEKARAAEEDERPQLEVSLSDDLNVLFKKGFLNWTGSIVFGLDRSGDAISRLKLRRPNSKEFTFLEDPYETSAGFFGLSWEMYKPLMGSQQAFNVPFVVEGEFDALSVMARQVLAGAPEFMILSAGGNAGGANVEDLYDLGFDKVHLFGDSPDDTGDVLVQRWMGGMDHLYGDIFCGYPHLGGAKDPDEAVVNLGLPAFQSILLDPVNFKTPPQWLFDGVSEDIANTPVEQTRRRNEIASAAGQTLRNEDDREDFVKRCFQAFGLEAGALKREMSTHTDTEEGYVFRVAAELKRIFFVIGTRREGSRLALRLWHRETKKELSVLVNDLQDQGSVLMPFIGNVWKFFDEKIGVPEWVEASAAGKRQQGLNLKRKNDNLKYILCEAFNAMTFNATDISHARIYGQGIHRVDVGSECEIYFVNGTDVYHGFFDGDVLKWRELEGPSVKGIVFETENTKWASGIHCVDDLKRATEVDVEACADKLEDVLSIGWNFKSPHVTPKFLAAHLMATTVSAAFDRKVIVAFHADTSSGKSKLLLGLLSGLQDQDIHLIEATKGVRSFSAAGFKRDMNEKALAPCIDEFENDGSGRGMSAVENIQTTIFRGLQHGNNVQKLGARDGGVLTYSLNFFVFYAAIHRARNAQDSNRVVEVTLQKVEGRTAPDLIILEKYGAAELKQLKLDLTLALLPHMKTLRDNFRELDKEIVPGKRSHLKIEDRLKSGLLPSLSVMKLLKRDYMSFLTEFCQENSDILISSGSRTDSRDIFDWVTQSAFIPVTTSEGKIFCSFLSLLMGTPEMRAVVNTSGTGLFYDENTRTLVVNWTMATQSVLKNNEKFGRSASHQNLREMASRVPFALKTPALEASGALARLRNYGIAGIPAAHLTGYSVAHILDEAVPDVAGEKKEQNNVIPLPTKKTNDPDFG